MRPSAGLIVAALMALAIAVGALLVFGEGRGAPAAMPEAGVSAVPPIGAGDSRSETGSDLANLAPPAAGVRAAVAGGAGGRTGSLSGQVLNRTGAGLSQVAVEARSGGEIVALATTGQDGRYELLLPEGLGVEVAAARAGWRIERTAPVPRRVLAGDGVDFRAVPAEGLVVRVVDASGEPVERARLELRTFADLEDPFSVEWTPSRGPLELAPGGYVVQALIEPREWPLQGGGALAFTGSERQQVTIEAGSQPEELVLTVGPLAGVFGRVALPAELPPGYLPRIGFLPQEAGQAPHPGYFGWKAPLLDLAEDTRFAFAVDAPGTYYLGLVGPARGLALDVIEVEVQNDWVELAPEFPAVEDHRVLEVMLRDSDGLVMSGDYRFGLRLTGSGEAAGEAMPQVLGRSATGAYQVLLGGPWGEAYWGGDESYGYELSVEERVAPLVKESLAPGTPFVELQLREMSGVVIQLVGAFQEERANLSCRLTPTDTPNRSYSISNFDETGRASWDELPVGETRVLLAWRDASDDRFRGGRTLTEALHTLGPGINEIEVPVPTLHELRVRAPGLNPNSILELSPEFEGSGRGMTMLDEDSEAVFGGLLPGDYVLQGGNDSQSGQRVRVPGPAVDFEPSAAAGLRVVQVEPQGLLAAAGLRLGCRIQSVGGEPATERKLREALSRAYSTQGGRIELSVDCGSGASSTSIPIADVGEFPRIGGTLVPWIE